MLLFLNYVIPTIANPSHIKIKTSRSSPILLIVSYSSLSFIFFPCLLVSSFLHLSHFILSSCFPLMSLPFLYLSHHDILLFHSILPPVFSYLFLICFIPLSRLLYSYIKTDVGSLGTPLKPSLANTNPAH